MVGKTYTTRLKQSTQLLKMTEQSKKIKLLKVLDDAAYDAQDVISKGREMVHYGQRAADLIRCNKDFLQLIPDASLPNETWNNQISQWENWRTHAHNFSSKFGETASAIAFATTDSTSATATVVSIKTISSLPLEVRDPALVIYEKFEQILEQSSLIQKIGQEIQRLGCSSMSLYGKESALSLLQQAEAAFRTPSINDVAPSAVLIPLREAINRILDNLLKNRPTQEKTKGIKEKIHSICNQCSRKNVLKEQIERHAQEAYNLNDLLSEAKQSQLTRDYVRELLNRGLIFLLAFLLMLDEQKMRPFAGSGLKPEP